ncbi:MAG: PAS domain S-box protein, partial [Syntrophales bacterium]
AADIRSNFIHLKMINIKEISLLDEKGTVLYSTTAVAMGENHSHDNFFSWARDPENNGVVWIGYEKTGGRRVPVTAGSPASIHGGIFLVTPLYRESAAGGRQKPGGKFAGTLMFTVDMGGMLAERSLLFTPLMKFHKLWITDKDGTVLLQSEHPEMVMRNIREKDEACNQCHASFGHVETMLEKVEGITEYQLKGGQRKIAAFASMSFGNASWIVVVNAPLDEVTAFVQENLKETFLLLGLLVFVLGIAFFFAYRNYREKVDHETAINTLLTISLLNIRLEEQLDKMFEIIISLPWLKVEAKGCIFLVKEKSDVLVMAVQKGLHPSLLTMCAEVPFGHCICGRAALTGETEFADRVDERHDNQYEGISPHGHYCVPIKFHDKVLGVLNLYLRAGHRRDKRDEEFLQATTDVMASIIERKRAEGKLLESEGKYRNILESIEDGYFEVDIAGNFTFFNDSVCRMAGYIRTELMGMNDRQFTDKENRKILYQAFNKVFRTGEPSKGVAHEIIGKDGTKLYIESSASLIRNTSGQPIGFRGIMRNITERKQAEEACRNAEARYRTLFEQSPNGILLIDPETGKTIESNETAHKQLGYTREEFAALRISDYEALEKPEETAKHIQKVIHVGVDDFETLHRTKSGEIRNVHVWSKKVQLSDRSIFYALFQDITERRYAEKQLQQTLENLRKAFGTTVQVMVSAVEARDPYTSGHQIRSADLARSIAMEMGLPQGKIDGIRMAGSIHDIGKLSIPAEILSKPTKLSEIEFSLIKEHARRGFEMLKDVESPWPLAEIVYQHHERMDGSGYPRNLKGDDILMEARILTVADVVESMASHRPYRPGLGRDAAMNEIENNRGILYDTDAVDACLKLLREKGYQLK